MQSCVRAYSVGQACPTLCNCMDCSCSVHGIFQARILAWLSFPPPRDLPDPGIEPAPPALQVEHALLMQLQCRGLSNFQIPYFPRSHKAYSCHFARKHEIVIIYPLINMFFTYTEFTLWCSILPCGHSTFFILILLHDVIFVNIISLAIKSVPVELKLHSSVKNEHLIP